jgi:hypothetical protein
MTGNKIQEVRETLARELASARRDPDERIVESSPCGRYELELNFYATARFPDRVSIAVAVVRATATGEVIATIPRNDEQCFQGWVTRDGRDYFLFAEDLEGQSVAELSTRRVEGFSSEDETFIWTEFHPSPDGSKVAILGCYWACPYAVTVYDFREPMSLPLPILGQFPLPENDGKFSEWTCADSFTVLDREGTVHVFSLSPTEPR